MTNSQAVDDEFSGKRLHPGVMEFVW